MTARIAFRVRDAVDMARFARCVAEGLGAPELAERFGLRVSTARVLAAQVRASLRSGETA